MRPTLAVWKFASCDGCQLALLGDAATVRALTATVDVALFPEITRAAADGPYDVSLVEGSVTTPDDVERVRRVREVSRVLVAMGACATCGGVQALRDAEDVDEYRRTVYPDGVGCPPVLPRSTPVAAHVTVDLQLPGCPVERGTLLRAVTAVLAGRRPRLPGESVCAECRRAGTVCVAVARGEPCVGPLTRAGCGALCPVNGRGCYGCFGPHEAADPRAWADHLVASGASEREAVRRLRVITSAAPPLAAETARRSGGA